MFRRAAAEMGEPLGAAHLQDMHAKLWPVGTPPSTRAPHKLSLSLKGFPHWRIHTCTRGRVFPNWAARSQEIQALVACFADDSQLPPTLASTIDLTVRHAQT